MAVKVVTFPILTFDEHKLSPAFGYVFDPRWVDPCESIVTILWKFARMNRLAGHVVASHLSARPIDPYEGVAPTLAEVDVRRLRESLRLPLKVIRGALIRDRERRLSNPYFRFCRSCLGRGYHSVLHQAGHRQHCPAHGAWLESECRHCGYASPYRLDARLLDAPFRCPQCRNPYSLSSIKFADRRPLPLKARVALTRARIA